MDFSIFAVVGTVAAIIGFRFYQLRRAEDAEARLAVTGVPLVGVLVQANTALLEPGDDDLPAQVLISFPGPNQAAPPDLGAMAQRIIALKSTEPATPLEKQLARLVRDELFRPGRRDKLPLEFTGGKEVYSVGLRIRREYLPERRLTRPFVHCAAIPGDSGIVAMTPYRA